MIASINPSMGKLTLIKIINCYLFETVPHSFNRFFEQVDSCEYLTIFLDISSGAFPKVFNLNLRQFLSLL